MFQDELTDYRHKQLPRYLIEVINQALNSHRLQLEKGL